jgi:hypothetical protein
MDVNKMVAELREEHKMLTEAIGVLEVLSLGGKKRRGRPPKWAVNLAVNAAPAKRRGRPPGSQNKLRVESAQVQ